MELGLVLFAIFNAALEEAIYRGLVIGALDASLGRGATPVLLRAIEQPTARSADG